MPRRRKIDRYVLNSAICYVTIEVLFYQPTHGPAIWNERDYLLLIYIVVRTNAPARKDYRDCSPVKFIQFGWRNDLSDVDQHVLPPRQ